MKTSTIAQVGAPGSAGRVKAGARLGNASASVPIAESAGEERDAIAPDVPAPVMDRSLIQYAWRDKLTKHSSLSSSLILAHEE